MTKLVEKWSFLKKSPQEGLMELNKELNFLSCLQMHNFYQANSKCVECYLGVQLCMQSSGHPKFQSHGV